MRKIPRERKKLNRFERFRSEKENGFVLCLFFPDHNIHCSRFSVMCKRAFLVGKSHAQKAFAGAHMASERVLLFFGLDNTQQ